MDRRKSMERFKMKWIGIMAVFMTIFSTIGVAQTPIISIGECMNSTHIRYTTVFDYNGEQYNFTTATMECNEGCGSDLSDIGDECRGTRTASTEATAIWLGMWAMLIWLWNKYTMPSMRKIVVSLILVNAWSGIFIIQNFILFVPIVTSVVLWLWVFGAFDGFSEWVSKIRQ